MVPEPWSLRTPRTRLAPRWRSGGRLTRAVWLVSVTARYLPSGLIAMPSTPPLAGCRVTTRSSRGRSPPSTSTASLPFEPEIETTAYLPPGTTTTPNGLPPTRTVAGRIPASRGAGETRFVQAGAVSDRCGKSSGDGFACQEVARDCGGAGLELT